MLAPFLLEQHKITVSDHNLSATDLVLHHCQFDPEIAASEALFREAKIILPQRLNNASNGRKAEYLAGRICASNAVREFNIKDANIGSNEDRSPVWPQGIAGSISHKKNWAVAAVSATHQYLGVDLELNFKLASANKIAKKIINEAEADLIATGPFDFARGLTVVFSAKEALYKAIYPFIKRYLPFHICAVDTLSAKHLVLKLQNDLSEEAGCNPVFYVYCHWYEDGVITLVAQ